MKRIVFKKTLQTPVSVESLWDWHQRPGAFERLAPAWQRLVPVDMPEGLEEGAEGNFQIKAGPIKLNWKARISEVDAPHRFVDEQLSGPFASWKHEHRMEPAGEGGSRLTDEVTYALPAGLGRIGLVRRKGEKEVERLFSFRHRRMADDLERHAGDKPGKGRVVLVSGSTGLIGRRLSPYLRTLGYEVRGLTRGKSRGNLHHWDPASGEMDDTALHGVDAVIHLAGENIASGRWTEARKQRILDSRISGTGTLVRAMSRMERPPSAFISASGANYYGSGSKRKLESSPNGKGFLAGVCRAWEAEALKARDHGIRTCLIRTGIVLDPLGGALGKMLPAFKAGMGGRIGDGTQAFPWIAMDDLLDIYERALRDESLEGPINAVHPERLNQRSFSKVLGRVLGRPAFIPLPALVIKTVLGQMGKETLLADLPLDPGVLLDSGHLFRFERLEDSLTFMLGRR